MAWIYLAELADLPSDSKSGSDRWHIASSTDIARAFSCHACKKTYFLPHQSGTTSEPLTFQCCVETWTSLRAGSPVKISALWDLNTAWKASEASFSLKSSDWCVSYDQASFSWKTSQLSLFGGLIEFSWSSLRSGMILAGRLFQPKKLEPLISEKGGSCLPTPTASDYGKNVGRKTATNKTPREQYSLTILASRGELPGHPRGPLNPEWIEQAMGYFTKWTEIKPWAIQWCQPKRKKRLKDCAV
jgi:hypothetical protein